jgi:excisionase family DNA binding protein
MGAAGVVRRWGAPGVSDLIRIAPADPWLTTDQAAAHIGFTKRTLQKWRAEGKGPPWKRVNGHQARYLRSAVDAWMVGLPDGGLMATKALP